MATAILVHVSGEYSLIEHLDPRGKLQFRVQVFRMLGLGSGVQGVGFWVGGLMGPGLLVFLMISGPSLLMFGR